MGDFRLSAFLRRGQKRITHAVEVDQSLSNISRRVFRPDYRIPKGLLILLLRIYINYMATKVSGGTVHTMPRDLHTTLLADSKMLAAWEDITPLARNEFICWIENAKHIETRNRRIQRSREDLRKGERRPCCWLGCIHRPDKAISPSVQWVLSKKSKKRIK